MNDLKAGRPNRDWWVNLGMAVSATSAAVSSFAGLRALAVVAGWPGLLAALLPLTVDAYAMTATRVWLASSTVSVRARRFARWNAVGAIVLSLVGNGVYHLIAAGLVRVTWVIVVVVGAVPAAVLGLLSHMAVLRNQIDAQEPESEPRPVEQVEQRAQPADDDELLHAAREADAQHRAENDGRAISRDKLRVALRVSGQRATVLMRQLKAERAVQGGAPATG